MTDRIAKLRNLFIDKRVQREVREKPENPYLLAETFSRMGTEPARRAALRLCYVLNREKPVIFEDERIVFTRTVTKIPEIFTEKEMEELQKEHWIHEKGEVCNISVDYTLLLHCGLDTKKQELQKLRDKFESESKPDRRDYVSMQIAILDAIEALADRYRQLAEKQGNRVTAQILSRIPAQAPETFPEALQMLRILHFVMWCGGNYHNTIGRFDQYMYPYFKRDLDEGRLTEDEALELVEEFFLTFNRDSDLYPGIQQGDNGQSLVLGGTDARGQDCFNPLSRLCLKASLELHVIDPKINLRVHKRTTLEQYILGTQLTKIGLGFPQYSNDDVVIPGLEALGYSHEDACNYVVAACWEFIIPGKAMDIPNIEALSFPECVQETVEEELIHCEDYEQFRRGVCDRIRDRCRELCEKVRKVYIFPAPFLSLMMSCCGSTGKDISEGGIYNNYGFHGTGLATAADSMAAVKKYVFEDRTVSRQTMLDAVLANFEGYALLRNRLRFEAPKMGNDDDYADEIGVMLLDCFADALQGKRNDRGGIFRAGTGSAMYYIWHSRALAASPDGRDAGEAFGCNYSPSLFTKCKGPVSILKSFSKPHLSRVVNGGPLTMELHDTVFRNEDSIRKVAMLVKSFFDMGGHQLQINAVNRDSLLDAQKHPEKYKNLIVRVWGWSGYFVELDKVYQDHIIQRMEHSL